MGLPKLSSVMVGHWFFFDTGSFSNSPRHLHTCLRVYAFVQLTPGYSELHLAGPWEYDVLAKE